MEYFYFLLPCSFFVSKLYDAQRSGISFVNNDYNLNTTYGQVLMLQFVLMLLLMSFLFDAIFSFTTCFQI